MGLILEALGLKLALRANGKRAVAFDLPSLGEWQFIGPVIRAYAAANPRAPIVLVHHRDTVAEFSRSTTLGGLKCHHVRRAALDLCAWPEIALFLTSEQYDLGLDGVYSVAMFHGQAAKGLSFTPKVILSFDGLFLNGPMHREAFGLFVDDFLGGRHADIPIDLYEIGYPKSDALLNGAYDRSTVAAGLGLTGDRPIVLYAPAFNEGASLREQGLEIIDALSAGERYDVLVKLPIDIQDSPDSAYATGGVDWFARIKAMEATRPNLRLYTDYEIDPLLACADVLVTCISSVGFEFMCLGKPVVYVDTPAYFAGYLARQFPGMDTSTWAARTTVNGGQEFGLVVSSAAELPAAVETVLSNPAAYPRQRDRIMSYVVHNPGRASETAAGKVAELVALGARSHRPSKKRGLLAELWALLRPEPAASDPTRPAWLKPYEVWPTRELD